MRTRCPECTKVFNIAQSDFLKTVTCHFCKKEFTAVAAIENKEIDLGEEDSSTKKSIKTQVLEEIKEMRDHLNPLLPEVSAVVVNKGNESDTRLVLDKIFQQVLGYDISEIKTEQRIQGKRADYVLSVNGKDVMVVEAKRAGMNLGDKQIFQATAYAAYSGIRWALLTNGCIWQLYNVIVQNKVSYVPMYSVDIREGLNKIRDAQYFYLLSKSAMGKQSLLEKTWLKIDALRYENIVNTILQDEVTTKIAQLLSEEYGCNIQAKEVKSTLTHDVFQLDT